MLVFLQMQFSSSYLPGVSRISSPGAATACTWNGKFSKRFVFSIEQPLAPRTKSCDYIEHCHHHHLLLVIALVWDIWNIVSWGCWYLPHGPWSAPCRPGLSVRTVPGQTFSPSEEALMMMMMMMMMVMMMMMWRQTMRMRREASNWWKSYLPVKTAAISLAGFAS